MNTKSQKVVPVFYASDENYLPFLGVALASLKAHCNEKREYAVHVLTNSKLGDKEQAIKDMQTQNVKVYFHDVSKQIRRIMGMLHCRDYYTPAIFYRLFIPDLFPQYDKAIYLDCDTILQADIAELFDIDLQENYLGAVVDQAVQATKAFRDYTRKALDIEPDQYFNSGVLTLNLKRLREIQFYDTFCSVLRSYRFTIAPDQDCLNLICKNKVHYYGAEWNRMPIGGIGGEKPKLVHYNLSLKPWHYDGVPFGELFWEQARKTQFFAMIEKKKSSFTKEMALKDKASGERLIKLAEAEATSKNNYIKTVQKLNRENKENMTNEVGRYAFNGSCSKALAVIAAD